MSATKPPNPIASIVRAAALGTAVGNVSLAAALGKVAGSIGSPALGPCSELLPPREGAAK